MPGLLGVVAGAWGVGKVMLLPALGSGMVCVLVLLVWLETRLTRAEARAQFGGLVRWVAAGQNVEDAIEDRPSQ